MKRLFILLCALLASSPAIAADDALTKVPDAQEELTLNDVRDVGMILNYIRRQAISIYEEAARPNVDVTYGASVRELQTIPEAKLPAKVLPPRQEWLVFYLGTMETAIRQLVQEVADIDKGTSKITASKRLETTFTPLYEQWASQVKDLNHHLDELVPLFDQSDKNGPELQRIAVAIYNDTNKLEDIRRSIFTTMRDLSKQHPEEKIMVSPPVKQ